MNMVLVKHRTYYKKNISIFILNVAFIMILILQMTSFGEDLCETSPNSEEVKYIINLVKKQFNIQTLKCTYTVIVDDLPSYINLLKEEGKKVNEEVISKGEMETLNFVYKNGNFLKIITGTKEISEEKNQEKPQNILELIALKNQERRKAKMGNYPRDYQFISYFYQGKLKTRHYSFSVELDRYAYSQPLPLYDNYEGFERFLDPRVCIGYCKEKDYIHPYSKSPIYITDFLEKEGKFYYYEKDGFKILWHGAEVKRGKVNELICVEIWIDTDHNISKIRSIFYPSRFLGKEELRNLFNETSYTCEHPGITFWEYTYYDHKEFENGIRIPMRTIVLDYNDIVMVKRNPSLRKIVEEHSKPGQVDYISIYSILSKYPDISVPCRKREILIHPESVVINEPIPEKTFIAPEPDIPWFKSPEEAKEFLRKAGEERMRKEGLLKEKNSPLPVIIFIASCVTVTLIGMLITKRYFGWGP